MVFETAEHRSQNGAILLKDDIDKFVELGALRSSFAKCLNRLSEDSSSSSNSPGPCLL